MNFTKYHALGNDYLVLDPRDEPRLPANKEIRTICHRNYGLGSDGILYGPLNSDKAQFGLRIYNPDASEAEKSGNGLRIFVRYLLDCGHVEKTVPFTVETAGGVVECVVRETGLITVEMGKVRFHSDVIPVTGPPREVINEHIQLEGKDYTFCAATVGNPHVVLPLDKISDSLARKLGPVIENYTDLFPNRTNVQLLKVIDRNNIQIEIWERGAGYTLASGTSSCAAAGVARKLGLIGHEVTVHMPGGRISLTFTENFDATMTGPVTKVGTFMLDPESLA